MNRQHHYLKCETEYFQEVERGYKKFELRKNDRDFKVYDMVCLMETVNGIETGRKLLPFEISYIIRDEDAEKYGLRKGYCIFNW